MEIFQFRYFVVVEIYIFLLICYDDLIYDRLFFLWFEDTAIPKGFLIYHVFYTN